MMTVSGTCMSEGDAVVVPYNPEIAVLWDAANNVQSLKTWFQDVFGQVYLQTRA